MSNFPLTLKLLVPNLTLHWKDNEYPGDNVIQNVYRSKRKDYRSRLQCFLNQVETDKIKKLSIAVSTDEKLFWNLLKGQRSSSQMSSFLVDENLSQMRNRFVKSGLAILRNSVPPLKIFSLIVISLPA